MHADPLHAARLAQLEGALCALLREAREPTEFHPNDVPDGITARLHGDVLDIEYTRGGMPVAGEVL
jgi:hypothetical protein